MKAGDTSAPGVLLFCDANAFIGTGHVTRCYALAQALTRAGLAVTMTGTIDQPDWLIELITPYFRPLHDVVESQFALVVIDSYDPETFTRVTERLPHLAQVHVVDDSTPVLAAEAYIEPGINSEWSPPAERASSPRVLGAEAVLIRDELRRRGEMSETDSRLDPVRITVSLGGSDGYGLREPVLEALADTQVPMHVSLITPHPIESRLAEEQSLTPVSPGRGLKEITETADVIISAAGVSSWEFLHQGKPTALICAVDNQEANYRFMTSNGLALSLGRWYLGEELNVEGLARLLREPTERDQLARLSRSAVDGLGADRAADMIKRLIESTTA